MLKKIEAYFMKEMSEKAGRIAVFSLGLLIPNYGFRMLFLFLLVTTVLPTDIHNKRISNLLALPYSHGELFWISLLFLVGITTSTEFLGAALFGRGFIYTGINLWRSLNFIGFYYAVSMLSVIAGLDNFGIPFLIFILDIIMGGIGSTYENPYFYISPVYQGKSLAVTGITIATLLITYLIFTKKGVQK